MTRLLVRSLLLLLAAALSSGTGTQPLRAAEPEAVDAALGAVVAACVEAALEIASHDAAGAAPALEQAVAESAAARAEVEGLRRRDATRLRRATRRLSRRLDTALAALPRRGPSGAFRQVRRAVRAAVAARRVLLAEPPLGFGLREERRGAGFHRAGRTVVLRLVPGRLGDGSPCAGTPDVVVEPLTPPREAVEAAVEDLGEGRFRLRLGPDLGAARVRFTLCGVTRDWLLVNSGSRGDVARGFERNEAPSGIAYAGAWLSFRAGVPGASEPPTHGGGAADRWSVDPALPEGLVLDPRTGAISGIPAAPSPTAIYTVAAENDFGSATLDLPISVTPPLDPRVEFLAAGFAAEPWLDGLAVPVKIALAPDGRLLFNELGTGNVRVVDRDGNLLPAPFATVDVLTGGERGLLGLALAPDFETSGEVFVFASVAASDGRPDRNQVIRFTAAGDVGTDPTVVVDDLPIGFIHNAGDLEFGPDGKLYVSVGDTAEDALAQADGSLAGRILRYERDGSVPADNPDPASPEWCRGLRNSFDLAFHPRAGGLFGTENGPTFGDELNFLLPGRNYGWPSLPPDFPGSLLGARVAEWTPVIAPTGIAFHSGAGFGEEFGDDLFLLAYDEAEVRRLRLSGPAFTDLDEELPFARFADDQGVENKPLDVLEGPAGTLLVATFSSVWKISRY